MSIDYKKVYQEFEQLKREKDLSEYSSERVVIYTMKPCSRRMLATFFISFTKS